MQEPREKYNIFQIFHNLGMRDRQVKGTVSGVFGVPEKEQFCLQSWEEAAPSQEVATVIAKVSWACSTSTSRVPSPAWCGSWICVCGTLSTHFPFSLFIASSALANT